MKEDGTPIKGAIVNTAGKKAINLTRTIVDELVSGNTRKIEFEMYGYNALVGVNVNFTLRNRDGLWLDKSK